MFLMSLIISRGLVSWELRVFGRKVTSIIKLEERGDNFNNPTGGREMEAFNSFIF